MPRYNYAFDFAAEIETDKEFLELTAKELGEVMLKRLHQVMERDEREAFDCFDEIEEENDKPRD